MNEKINLEEIASQIEENYKGRADAKKGMGTAYEIVTKYYLKHTRRYNFANVWLWEEYPEKDGPDTGVDIVCQDEEGNRWTVQVKERKISEENISENDISNFAQKSDAMHCDTSRRIIVLYGCGLNKTAESLVEKSGEVVIHDYEIEEENLDWSELLPAVKLPSRTLKEAFDYQKEAIAKCLEKFETANKGQLIMACGTGKTLTSLRLMEEMSQKNDEMDTKEFLALYLAPSITLTAQTYREYTDQSKSKMGAQVVCSDATANRIDSEDDPEGSVLDFGYPVTTDPRKLADNIFAQKHTHTHTQILI